MDKDYYQVAAIKQNIVESDAQREMAYANNNFGHTVGHAIEALSLQTKNYCFTVAVAICWWPRQNEPNGRTSI
jgi:3-dehydroquinate synthetase